MCLLWCSFLDFLDGCVDKNADCNSWAKYCQSTISVIMACRNTCGVCSCCSVSTIQPSTTKTTMTSRKTSTGHPQETSVSTSTDLRPSTITASSSSSYMFQPSRTFCILTTLNREPVKSLSSYQNFNRFLQSIFFF